MAFHCVRCQQEIDRAYKACPHCGEPITDFTREYADKLIDGMEYLISKKHQIKLGVMHELLSGKRRLPGFAAEWSRRPRRRAGG